MGYCKNNYQSEKEGDFFHSNDESLLLGILSRHSQNLLIIESSLRQKKNSLLITFRGSFFHFI